MYRWEGVFLRHLEPQLEVLEPLLVLCEEGRSLGEWIKSGTHDSCPDLSGDPVEREHQTLHLGKL